MTGRSASRTLRHAGPGPIALAAMTMIAAMGILLMAAAQPAAGQPRPASDTQAEKPSAPHPAAVPSDAHETYRSRVRDEMAEWRRKMETLDGKAQEGGTRVATAAETRLRAAWDDTEVEARKVDVATARDWDRTKRTFEAASRRMAEAWDRVRL